MTVERTLSIIKPDAVERNLIGAIVSRFESEGLRPVAMRRSLLFALTSGAVVSRARNRL